MKWDLRNTRAPVIANGNIDLFLMGELRYMDTHKDECNFKPEYMEFAEPTGDRTTNSQLVISEPMASCSLSALARSTIGSLHLSTSKLNTMFEMFPKLPKFKMDSTTVGKYMPLFREKLGKDVPLHAMFHFKSVDVKFGEFDTDVILSYTLCIRFKEDDGKSKGHEIRKLKDLFYDELRIVTTGSIKTREDTLYMQILSHKLDNGSKYAQ